MEDFARIHLAIATATFACSVACGGTSTGGATQSIGGNGGQGGTMSGTGGSGGQGGIISGTGGQGGASALPPAQAAVSITISAGASGACTVAGGQITVPPDTPGNVGQVGSVLSCDLTNPACTPDQFVVVHGDPETSVVCSVAASGYSFDVNLSVQTGSRMSFSASGQITSDGGTLAVYEFDQNTQRTLQDPACSVSIVKNFGTVKKGAIWASFQCSNFTDAGDISGASCSASGSFIFENCGS